jgi:hypothetical protein
MYSLALVMVSLRVLPGRSAETLRNALLSMWAMLRLLLTVQGPRRVHSELESGRVL